MAAMHDDFLDVVGRQARFGRAVERRAHVHREFFIRLEPSIMVDSTM
jgi:hypothetical protein